MGNPHEAARRINSTLSEARAWLLTEVIGHSQTGNPYDYERFVRLGEIDVLEERESFVTIADPKTGLIIRMYDANYLALEKNPHGVGWYARERFDPIQNAQETLDWLEKVNRRNPHYLHDIGFQPRVITNPKNHDTAILIMGHAGSPGVQEVLSSDQISNPAVILLNSMENTTYLRTTSLDFPKMCADPTVFLWKERAIASAARARLEALQEMGGLYATYARCDILEGLAKLTYHPRVRLVIEKGLKDKEEYVRKRAQRLLGL